MALGFGLMVGGAACSSAFDAEPPATDQGTSTGSGSYGVGGSGYGPVGSSVTTGGNPMVAPPSREERPEPTPACDQLDDSKPLVLYVSADDSNSMASPTLARAWMAEGVAPPPETLRTFEFLNYFTIPYEAPAEGWLNVVPQLEEAEPGRYDLQIGVRSWDAVLPRRPITVTFAVDTSGSMTGAPMERAKATVIAVAQSLAEGDIVNLVTWDSSSLVPLDGHVVVGPNDPTVVAEALKLDAAGSTDLNSGLSKGYQLANEHYAPDRLNRVILISDGDANAGVTAPPIIGENAQDADQEGIYLVGVGVGNATAYKDFLMDVVTDAGRGAYLYVDSAQEAEVMFHDRFDEVMEVAARGVQVELTLPWYFQIQEFYGEEFSENPEEIEPQHLAPSDAMVFNQVLEACNPSVVNLQDEITVRVTWQEPLTYLEHAIDETQTLEALLTGPHPELALGKAIIGVAEALREGSPARLDAAMTDLQALGSEGDGMISELQDLLLAHPAFPQ